VDLDFNYREPLHVDWGKERDVIDTHLKNILYELGYSKDAIKIQPSYPLGRIEVHYHSKRGTRTSLKIETGYLRRIPILRNDELCAYIHPMTGIKTNILTPILEELFANKFCTLLSRSEVRENPRDLFDVWTISKQTFDRELFVDVVSIELLLMKLDLTTIDVLSTKKPGYEPLRILLKPDINVGEVFDEARSFTSLIIKEILASDWQTFRDRFKQEKKIPLELLNNPDHINPNINNHPIIKRIFTIR